MLRLMKVGMLAATLALLPACASSGGKGEATGTSLGKAAAAIDSGQGQIDAALAALGGLSTAKGADLSSQFKVFQGALNQLASTAKDVSGKAEAMQRDGQAYFADWDKDLAAISDEGVRSRSEHRRNEVQQEFDAIAKRYQEVAGEFKPFMATLRDIETALKADLTADGVKSLSSVIKRATSEGGKVKASLTRLSKDFRSLSEKLAPAATAVGS
ncbi:MAG: DUF2959 family protein [Phycisphaerales bacterium]|jgi:hypothetical protein|nr:DUF2959 family protein [Phycisphaerales bacterium]